MHCNRFQQMTSRRDFLRRAGAGAGWLGLAGVLQQTGLFGAETSQLGHFPAKVNSVIWLFMRGGQSAMDTFHPKPDLTKFDGKKYSGEVDAFFGEAGPLMKSPFAFAQHGQSGAWFCEHYKELAKHADSLSFLHGCHVESNNHTPALLQMNSGIVRPGFPSAGSWANYGLGSINNDLPGYVVFFDPRGAPEGTTVAGSGFLPSRYEATILRPTATPILHLGTPPGVSRESQRGQLDYLAQLNSSHLASRSEDPALLGRIESFELAYRMQMTAPEAVDLKKESNATRTLYGLEADHTRAFGTQCLMARRLVERGVRFVQLYHGGGDADTWDAHGDLNANHTNRIRETDAPIAGLLTDLKQRGLLESTLVICGGEFGRLPVSQGTGRDHNPHGFSLWMTGGGIKPGVSHGATDELGHKAVEGRVSIHDLHATLLHLLGLDHTRLTYSHNGRRYRLTDVAGELVKAILA